MIPPGVEEAPSRTRSRFHSDPRARRDEPDVGALRRAFISLITRNNRGAPTRRQSPPYVAIREGALRDESFIDSPSIKLVERCNRTVPGSGGDAVCRVVVALSSGVA